MQLVEVDVRVTDRDDQPIRDLTVDDFDLLEKGVLQEISTFSFVDLAESSPVARDAGIVGPDTVSNAGIGRMWVMLLGECGPGPATIARNVARKFVQEALGAHDEVAVVHVKGVMSDAQGFTRNRRLLLDAIDRSDRACSPVPVRPYAVLEELSLKLGTFQGRRKAIVWFDPPTFFAPSSAQGAPSDPGAATTWFEQRDALRAATRNNVTIYTVSSRGLTTELGSPFKPGLDPLQDMAGQRLIAEETGGQSLVNSNNFGPAFQRFVRDTSTYYVLGYLPEVEEPDGSFHDITVRVRRPGVTVRARRGYYAERPRTKPVPFPAGPSPDIREAMRLPLAMGGLPLDVFAAPFRGAPGMGYVALGSQVHGADLMVGDGQSLEVGFMAITTEGKITTGKTRRFPLNVAADRRAAIQTTGLRVIDSIELPKGRHQVRFAVHQPDGRTGMVLADVDVPDFDREAVSLSGVLLSSPRTDEHAALVGDAQFQSRVAVKPTALRTFNPGDAVSAYVETYTNSKTKIETVQVKATIAPQSGAMPPRELALRRVTGEPRQSGYLMQVPVSELQAGSYVLQVDARAGRRVVSRQLLITIGSR